MPVLSAGLSGTSVSILVFIVAIFKVRIQQFLFAMPSNTPKARVTISSSFTANANSEANLDSQKVLMESFKNEIIKSFKEEISILKDTVVSLVSQMEKLKSQNIELEKEI